MPVVTSVSLCAGPDDFTLPRALESGTGSLEGGRGSCDHKSEHKSAYIVLFAIV